MMKEVNTLVESSEQQQNEVAFVSPLEEDGVEELQTMVSFSDSCDDVSVLSDEKEQQPIIMASEGSAAATSSDNNDNSLRQKRRRFFARFRRRRHHHDNEARMGAPSWWSELKQVETNGCSFVLAYIVMSFVLMTLMFNMREIVGDYCLGNNELKKAEYNANVNKAMQLRRRSPFSVDQEDRFEEELQAQLYYDKEGQLGDDNDYLRKHRVPILRSEDDEEEDDEEEELLTTRTAVP